MNQLREERERRGWSRPRAADELESLAHKRNIPVTATRDSIIRYFREWEHGRNTPQVPYRDLLCDLYARTAEELGIATAAAQARTDIGLVYASSLAETLVTVGNLAGFDAQKHPGVISGHFSEEALYAACLDWLFVSPSKDHEATADRVTPRDVAEIVATTVMFDGMDRSFGGDQSRDLAVKYFKDHVVPRLGGTYNASVGRDLFHAASVLCEVIGYMAYDSDRHALAQRYFIQSLRLAKEAESPAYGSYVLSTMSHQAMYLGRPREALRLAEAARQSYAGTHVAAVQTEAAMHAARAYAALGDEPATTHALLAAEKFFAQQSTESAPEWASHWGETVFAAFAGATWLDLGKPEQARPHLVRAAQDANGQARRIVYSAAQLAKLSMLEGDAEQASAYAMTAADTAAGLRSKRSTKVVRDLRDDFQQQAAPQPIQAFLTRVNDDLSE
ncbi:hypothetical protein [Lentzea jiangxiensis]|uniref:Transcriptional regulator n=1 Tax=Lentzea jiangxiensis TaxID=641025 RepID=A0A1H0DIT7_9PSEU|nr:hypothetical protein [Lentzea jiangxiensis]SDN70072.1 hypothetical protein SAMN05421507_1012 [Lentzea jiangxiensis]